MSSATHTQNSTHDENENHDDGVNEHTSLLRPGHNGKARAQHIDNAPASASLPLSFPNRPANSSNNTMSPPPNPPPPNATSPSASPSNTTLWSRLQSTYLTSLTLENKGSVARDHLAVERTFLAYIRTSLTFASLGIGITQLYRLNLPVRGTQTLSSPSGSSTPLSSSSLAASAASAAGAAQASASSAASASASAAPFYDTVDPITETVARSATALGLVFLGIAILILLSAWRRYFEVQRYVIRNQFPASRGLVLGVVFFTAAIIFGCAGVVIAVGVGS